jgi:hypothetical protein
MLIKYTFYCDQYYKLLSTVDSKLSTPYITFAAIRNRTMSEDAEIAAMAGAARAIEPLDETARRRVLDWLCQRFGKATPSPPLSFASPSNSSAQNLRSEFESFAELFDAAGPKTEKEKALVAAYWTQVSQGQPSFPAQALNSSLKDLGHGLGNITDSLDALKDEKPSLVLQLKKSGTSKQARKIYKLTEEGARRVRKMISKEE